MGLTTGIQAEPHLVGLWLSSSPQIRGIPTCQNPGTPVAPAELEQALASFSNGDFPAVAIVAITSRNGQLGPNLQEQTLQPAELTRNGDFVNIGKSPSRRALFLGFFIEMMAMIITTRHAYSLDQTTCSIFEIYTKSLVFFARQQAQTVLVPQCRAAPQRVRKDPLP